MSAEKFARSSANLRRALDRLDEAVAEPEAASRLVIDGTIQRFEFAIELFWKTLKHRLELDGVETATPRQAIARAFQAGWLDNETLWLDMLADRNRSSHPYDEAMARKIWQRIRAYAPAMRAAFGALPAPP
jgi:nucleotidyltransferase substrate binding protein (TIGR01987 family)